ncbi:MAG: GNAT family N-acetyltransferase [Phycisphaerales bacterium]|jgi:GNAT superfamily N-acetyltransferase|nr:GNAT family N-acetyltransferase [Phycisphaerales bacterium]
MDNGKEFHFRHEFNPGDIGRVVSLHGLIAYTGFGFDYRFEAYVAEYLGKFVKEENPRSRMWMLDGDDGILATIAVAHAGDDIAQLRWFGVDPSATGQGIGRALWHAALAFCKQQNYKEVFLWTVDGLDVARAMYDKSGFKVSEENTHEIWGQTLTEQKMTLVINAAT